MSEQIWTQQQRENTMRQLAQKMSHLTSRPFADLIKLATSLEEMAFNKAAGSQKEYLTVLSKRMKKLEAQLTGQQPPSLSQASSFAPVGQQPQQYEQPQAAVAQRQHQLFLQQQQLQLQQQQQQQLAAQQQQQMHMQNSQHQQHQQQAHSMHLPQQSTGTSTGSHEEDFANMADMFGLYNGAATATSHPQQQTYLHAQRLQQQQAMMPQIPRQGLNAEQLKQQQLFQQQQQRQQQLRQQQAQQARQQQQLQQQPHLRHQQQAQQAQPPATGYSQQSQSATSWQQPFANSTQLQASQQMAPDTQAQAEKDNQARIAQFWEIQGQLRKRYLPQLQALRDNPFMRSQHISQATREYVARATHVSLLRQDDPVSINAVSLMPESKLGQIRKLYHELEAKLKAITAAVMKLQEEMARKASAQRSQSQTPPPSQGLASPSHLSRPATPKASVPPSSGGEAIVGVAPNSRATSLLAEVAPATAPTSILAPALPPAAAPASDAAAAPEGGLSQPDQTHAQAAILAGVFPPSTHKQTDSAQLPTASAQVPASSAQAAPSLVSEVTQVNSANAGARAGPTMQSLLEDGHMFMPAMPAELQAELASSASSSFNGVATFGIMQQQLSSTFDGGAGLAGDLAADMLSSPRFALTDQDLNGGSGRGASAADEAAAASAAASVAAVNAAVSGQMSPGMNTAAFNAAAGAALSRAQTAPPIALLDPSLPQTPTVLSILASTAHADEAGNDPNSPASATTGLVGASHQKGGNSLEVKEAHSSHSAPCLSGLRKRRASDSNIATQMDVKRSRAHLAHVEAAIKQARETFKGVASLEATDSLYSQDCIMLTCTPVADSATADSADTWRVITLRISSSYPNEPPSVVVRMSRDAQLAPQGEAVRSVLETSLSTVPFPPALEGILHCWLSAIESVGKVFSSQQRSASQASRQATAPGQLGTGFTQPASFPMQNLLAAAKPAVISVGSLAPLANTNVASQGNPFRMLNGSAATAGQAFSALATSSTTAGAPFSALPISSATAGAPFPALATSNATAATLYGGSGIPQVPSSCHRRLQKQLSTGTQHSHAMLGAIQPGMPTASILPNGASPSMYSACNAVSNAMGSIESLVSAGLLPQGSLSSSQGSLKSSHALPQTSLGHLAALLDLPHSSALVAGTSMQVSGLQ